MSQTEGVLTFLRGGGEMGARMRAFDWAATTLGPAEAWTRSLKTAVRIMLSSRYAMWMAWGPELTFFCNDAYLPTVGIKRDWVLGARADRVWAEVWPIVAPRIERVLTTGESTWDEGLLLFLERSGFREETYHTFSYSPLADDDETIVGMLCVVTEDTDRIVGERRLRFLRDLGLAMADVRTDEDVWGAVRRCIAAEPRDLPFTLAYAFAEDGAARLASRTGLPAGHPAAPELVVPGAADLWGLGQVLAGHGARTESLAERLRGFPAGPWAVQPSVALVLPLAAQGQARPMGAAVVALNPHRPPDAGYRGFIDLFVSQIAAGLASAGAYEAERRRAEALAELDRAKTAFFSNVSHEFRTPLTLMLGPLEDVLDKHAGGLPGEALGSVETAHRNGLRLLRLVNGLLDFSRIEAGRAQARFEATDLAALTGELASCFRSATDKAGLELRIDCPPAAEGVFVDREMWEKIVLNLVSNAFKFTLEGVIEVSLRAAAGQARLTVRDTGAGIPAEELPRLFERFHRIEATQGRSFEGSGIGLALVQELVRLHHGAIEVDSVPGGGSTFVVTVPLGTAHLPPEQIAAPQDAASTGLRAQAFVEEALRWLPGGGEDMLAEGASPQAEAGAGGRVLLADDNADLRGYIARLLTERGYAVEAVGDGGAALARARAEPFDLVVTDVMMPGLDGAGLLRAIRADPALRDMPVVMLSARAGEEATLEGIGAGADDYLTKPFSARELLARVAANIAMSRMRREATAALAESEARFRNMADHAPVIMWVTDPEGRCTYVNRAWQACTGQDEPEALGEGWLRAVHDEDRAGVERALRRGVGAPPVTRLEYRVRSGEGAWRWMAAAAAPRFGSEGGFLGYVGSMADVTDRKEAEALLERRVAEEVQARAQAEDALRQAQKMEAVGQLTGGLAHDFNNLLTGIAGSLELLQTRLDQGRINELPRYIAAAQGASRRAAALTHRLLAFSRQQTLDPKAVDVNRLVAGMEELVRRTVGPSVEIEVVGAAGLWTTLVDASQLESALLNLCINARDAMPDGGRITIETANRWLDERTAKERDLPPGQYVSLCVTDTGTGMAPEVIARAFDPFFTTKPIGQGTGLGLSMIYGFARQSGGQVRIYSELGRGTTMCIYLPRHDGREDAAAEAEAEAAITGAATERGQTVLIVDDEATVRMLVTEALADLGYEWLEASDGPSASRLLRSDARIDLLVTDVGLPGGMNGRQVAELGRAVRPALRVLFITGYAENSLVGNGHLERGMHVLTKPFTIDVLADRIRSLINA